MENRISGKNIVVFSEEQWNRFAHRWGLTKRETEVTRLVCQGWNYKQIARGLGISYHTVTTLVWRVYKRMHVHDRVGIMIQLLMHYGVIEKEENK